MPVQIVSVDGVSINTVSQETLTSDVLRLGAAKFHLVNCPKGARISRKLVCADSVTMMSSARVEIWVTHRSADGNVTPANDGATLKPRSGTADTAISAIRVLPSASRTSNSMPHTARPHIQVRSNRLYGPNGALSVPLTPQYQVPAFTDAAGKNLCAPLASNRYRHLLRAPVKRNGATDPKGLGWAGKSCNTIRPPEKHPRPGTLRSVQSFDLDTTEPLCVQFGAETARRRGVGSREPSRRSAQFSYASKPVPGRGCREWNPRSPYYTCLTTEQGSASSRRPRWTTWPCPPRPARTPPPI